MVRLNQKTKIFSFLLKNPNVTPKRIAQALGIKAPSVRRAISDLRKENILTKPVPSGKVKIRRTKVAKQFTVDVQEKLKPIRVIYYRKIAKATMYCETKGTHAKHSKEMVFSITYEDNQIDRFTELVAEADRVSRVQHCHLIDDSWGYDDRKKVYDPPFEYPEIRVESET